MKKFYVLLLSFFLFFHVAYSQCPVINSAMVNSCGASEGINEFVVFTTTASATAGSYTLHYGSANPPSSGTAKLLGSNATTKSGPGNITSSSCTINEVTNPSTVIPTGSIVIFIPSDFETQYDVSALCGSGSIYVVYINRAGTWQSGGNLANNSGSSDRYIQVTNGANTCTAGVRTYHFGWAADTDGNALSWNAAGVVNYVNNGCTVIPPPPGVNITPTTPISVCNNATTATFSYTATGSPDKYSLDWNAAANAAGFVDVMNATLTASSFTIAFPAGTTVGTTYTGSLIATNTTSVLSSVPQNISITIIGKPVVPNIIGPASLCQGYTYYSLQNALAGGVWTSTTPALATVDNIGSVTGVSAGTAIITYTVTNGCGSTVSAPFNMSIDPVPIVADISGVSNICTGSSAAFTNSTPGGVWSSNGSAIAAVSSTGIVSGISPGGPVTITYTVTNACGPVSKTFDVTIGPAATVADIAGTPNVCVGSAVNLTNATTGGTWSSNNTAVATVNSTGVVTGIASGTAVISYSITSSCGSASKTFTVTVNAAPVLSTEITGTSNICKNSTTTLSNATPSGTWSSSNTAVATVSSTGLVTGVLQGTSTITYTLTNSCGTVSKTFLITVELAATVADITGSTNVCLGATTALSSTTAGGVWTSSDPSIASISSTGVVTGNTIGSVSITYSISSSCGNAFKYAPIYVIDKPAVPANITGDANVCIGNTVNLSNATTGGTWSSSNAAVATVSSTGVVTGIAQGNAAITYTVTNTCGSTPSLPFNVTVNTPPVMPDISGVASICLNSTATFTNTLSGGTWSSSNTSIATVSSTGVVTGVAVGGPVTITYTVVTNSCGPVSKTFQTSVINSIAVPDIAGASSICAATTTTLTNAIAGGAWSSSNTSIATVSNTGVVTGVAQGAATISYTVASSCGNTTKTFSITINDKPALPPNITGTSSICLGTNTTLANAVGGGTWSSSNTTVASINAAGLVTSISTGQTTITYTVANSCGTTSSNPFIVTVNGPPVVADITGPNNLNIASTITLSNTTAGGIWSSTNTSIATVNTNGVVTGIAAGKDTILYTVTNSCGTTIKKHPIEVMQLNNDDVFIPNAFTPNGDGKNDVLQVYGNSIVALDMKVFNQWGELIYTMKDVSSKWDGSYKGRQQPVGVYIYVAKVRFQSGNTVTKKGSVNLIR